MKEFIKRPILTFLEKLQQISDGINISSDLDSLQIFLSNETKEIAKSTPPVKEDKAQISETITIGSLMKLAKRDFEYLILLLSQSGARLFIALNNSIVGEIENDYFPFSEKSHFNTKSDIINNPKSDDNTIREYFNKVDKAVIKVYTQTGHTCLVICTDDNYGRLMQVADKLSIYAGHTSMDFNRQSNFQIAAHAWEIMKKHQLKREKTAIVEMKKVVGHGKTTSDIFKSYLAVKEGRANC